MNATNSVEPKTKSEYLGWAHKHQKTIVDHACDAITKWEKDHGPYDAIAFTGMSGAMIAPVLAYRLDKKMICVRKDESKHAENRVEGPADTCKYIIVDDFIASGSTVIRIVDSIRDELNSAHECVGLYTWNASRKRQLVFGETYDKYKIWHIPSVSASRLIEGDKPWN